VNPRERERMREIEGRHWYFVGKRELIVATVEKLLPRDRPLLLDVGCGTGSTVRALNVAARPVGVDESAEALLLGARRADARLCVARGDRALPFRDETFRLVTALDVLEHVEDDRLALRHMSRVCERGGHLLITVPAQHFLWSEHDDALGDRRRYGRQEIIDRLRETGFDVLRSTYFNSLLFPAALLFRLGRRAIPGRGSAESSDFFVELPRWVNALFLAAFRFERILLARIDLPIGVSLLAIARRPS